MTWVLWGGLVFQILGIIWCIFLIRYGLRETAWWKRLGNLAEKQVWFLKEFVRYRVLRMPRNAAACKRSAEQIADETNRMIQGH